MAIGYRWRPWYGHPRPATEETSTMTDTAPTTPDLPTSVGRLTYIAQRSRDAAQKAAARAELARRGLDPRNGAKTTPKESA